jgi:hypothetical protein
MMMHGLENFKFITTDPLEIIYEGVEWIDLAQDRNR